MWVFVAFNFPLFQMVKNSLKLIFERKKKSLKEKKCTLYSISISNNFFPYNLYAIIWLHG